MPTIEKAKSQRRTQDEELRAMGAIQRALDDLSEPARSRVIGWVVAKYALHNGQEP